MTKNVVLNLFAKSKTVSTTILLDEEIIAELDRLSRLLKDSKSHIIRDVLRNVLITRKGAPKPAEKKVIEKRINGG